jgi:hypothetical protein
MFYSCQAQERDISWYLYYEIQHLNAERVLEVLSQGADPNYCKGEIGWIDSNPLSVLGWYNTRSRFGLVKEMPDPTPDIAILNMLVANGADINRRPYIWDIIFIANNGIFERIEFNRRADNKSMDETDVKNEQYQFVSDVNRLLKGFLDAGANPDKLGHPYIHSNNIGVLFLTDKRAEAYFKNGTRAINVAIEKGIMWESQVDLLLQYTTLDEESLRAAERSGDPAMIEKINKLWNIQ